MTSPLQTLLSLFLLLLLLPFQSFSTSAATTATSTLKTSSKDQVACQMCTSCDNPCPVYPPPPPPVGVLCPPPPPPPSPPPPPNQIPQYPPPPATCLACQPSTQCTPGVIGGAIYGPPNGGSVPYFPYSNMNPPAGCASSASSLRKFRSAFASLYLLLVTLWF